jgi:diamine N-acetyltransferase
MRLRNEFSEILLKGVARMIVIRFVTSRDIPLIQSIANEAWNYTYKGIYTEDFIHHFLSRAYSSENLDRAVARDLQSPQRKFLIAEYNNEIVGFAQAAPVEDEAYELLRIYIRPEYHRRGIGQRFIQEFIQILQPMKRLFAWVAKENSMGRAFYEKSGFKILEEKNETVEGQSKTQLKYELEIES